MRARIDGNDMSELQVAFEGGECKIRVVDRVANEDPEGRTWSTTYAASSWVVFDAVALEALIALLNAGSAFTIINRSNEV